MVKGTFWKISKRLSHFKEESYEITQIFEEFGQISSFLLLKLPNYLSNNFELHNRIPRFSTSLFVL